jgi:hypothetical protein
VAAPPRRSPAYPKSTVPEPIRTPKNPKSTQNHPNHHENTYLTTLNTNQTS